MAPSLGRLDSGIALARRNESSIRSLRLRLSRSLSVSLAQGENKTGAPTIRALATLVKRPVPQEFQTGENGSRPASQASTIPTRAS